ncbi:O-acetyl-ADP-ribose deacetylase (regulator of RNase III) [Thermovibrio guaymasensis]|uniref:O-acetyl-ADP-ribose deacetylase (Regulator of RNase III) n=1 Tax=Thermovibrio guaymasensis TaxID=240167 RepID=A0A420W7T0_9BACT|nr:macro domain-containing protein [Thermovibrio guaymasensis]RKQ63363.1 O-acetyl-ADP-ribose deacetylase (regulator of RNase III) [Thermovibrio guaymasensis]
MEVLLERVINGRVLKAVHGDITEEGTEAIVNAANSLLKHGGGVAGAIVKKGGKVIQEESDRIVSERGPVPVGGAVYTTAGNLKAKYVIHAVGPIWGEGDEERKLRSAVRSALKLADELGLNSIALPAISTGIFGYPKREGVRVIVDEVIRYLEENPSTSLKKIHFTAIDGETAEFFKEEIKSLT